MIKHIFFIPAIVFLLPSVASGESKCQFFAKADVGILEFTGTGCTIVGKPKIDAGKVSGGFIVDLTKLEAGDMALRTQHMRDNYLEVKKYPKAMLNLDPMPEAGGDFTGALDLHGVSKPIKGKAVKTANGWSFSLDIKTSDFGIKKAGYQGIEIAETIAISGNIDR